MKRHNVILESNVEPKDNNVLWLQGNKLKKFGNTGWENIIEGDVVTTDRIENGAVTTDKIAPNAFDSTLSKSEKIAPANIVGSKITTLDEKVDALALGKFYGYFPDSTSFPADASIPGYAYVRLDNSYKIWNFSGESWSDSGVSIDENDVIITTDRIEDGAVTSEKIATSAFDSTLSVSGKIAPADVVGGKLNELEADISKIKPVVIENYGTISNAADEEDLTASDDGVLKFKDRDSINGMGYVILRKDKTFAEQVTKENTIYEIRYDFDLVGEETSIGSNSVLKFCGGKLKNGTLKGANTYIDAPTIVCFANNVNFTGSFKNSILHADWIEKESTYSAASAINKFTNNSIFDGKTVVLDSGAYYLNTPIILRSCISLLGANQTYARNTISGNAAFNGKGLITLVLGASKNCKISNFTFDLTNAGTNAIYSNFEVEHLTVEDCYFANIKESFAAIMMDGYELASVPNGCNAINVYRNKFSGDGYGIVNVNGGDNCNIRDNNFISRKNSCIKWNGIIGTASVNIENNAIVGGGESLIDVSNVMTHTIRNNQIEVITPIVSEGIKNCVICIGSENFRNYCNHLEIAHNNINLKTGALTSPGTDVAVYINWVYGAIISNNNVSNAKTYVKGSEDKHYDSVLIIDNESSGISKRPDYNKKEFFIDPATRFAIIDFYDRKVYLGVLKLQYVATSFDVKEAGVISQKSGNGKRFVTYDNVTGAICDLNGYPSIRSGTTDIRKASALPNYLRGGTDMIGFCYFDTTLGKPVWFKGLDGDRNPIWVDATGEVV